MSGGAGGFVSERIPGGEYVLLLGEDKSTQKRDIKRAIHLARALKE